MTSKKGVWRADSNLATAADLGLQAHTGPPADVDRSDALGAVDLVAADGHKVNVEGVDVQGHLAHRLRCVRVEEDLVRAAELPDLLHGLDDACAEASGASAHQPRDVEHSKRRAHDAGCCCEHPALTSRAPSQLLPSILG